MSTDDIAARLREAERARVPIKPIRQELGEGAIAKAYEVQAANTRHRLAAGEVLRGRKVGLTSKAVQKQLGVDQPDFGMLFTNMERADGGAIGMDEVLQPKIEAEIAFVMAADVMQARPSLLDIMAATAYVLPCFEIVGSRIANWDIGIVDTIADNASSGLFVLGASPKRLTDFDFITCGMVMRENGEVKTTGAGAASLGNPVEAVRWLAEKLILNLIPKMGIGLVIGLARNGIRK